MLGELTAPAVLDLTTAAPRGGPSRAPSDYSVLMAQVRAARLLERSVAGYLPRGLVLAAMLAAGVTAFCWLGDSWWQLAVAAYFAVLFAQLGFLGHDAGHQQVFRSRRRNDNLGMLLSNLGIGISYAWWVDKHNRHHRHPNDPDLDPDVERNVLAWTAEQADRQRGALRFVARHQAGLFFPLLLLEAVNLHIGSVRTLLDAKNPRRPAEFVLLAFHVAAGITVLLLFLSPLKALAFLAVQQFLFGLYLGCSFAPNHKGMPMIGRAASMDFLRRQVLTSRNVRGGRAMAAAFGGLNYQIEHHLFPCMPSRNLRRCRPLVISFCAAQDIAYTESSLLGSYARALCALGAVRPTSS